MLPQVVSLYTSDTPEPLQSMGEVLIRSASMPGHAVMSAFDRVPLLWLMLFEENNLCLIEHTERISGDTDLLSTQISLQTEKSVALDRLKQKSALLSELLNHDVSPAVAHLSRYLAICAGDYLILDTDCLAATLKEPLSWWVDELLYAIAYLAGHNPKTRQVTLDQNSSTTQTESEPIRFNLGDWLIDGQIAEFHKRKSTTEGFELLGGEIELIDHGYGEWFSPADHPEQLQSSAADLRPFLAINYAVFVQALKEIISAHKQTHWSWYIFPQIKGLGQSAMSQRYAINSLDHAKRFLENKVLSDRLELCTTAMLQHKGTKAADIMGVVDAIKFHACMTLFDQVAPNSLYASALRGFFKQKPHEPTLRLLKA